LRPGWPKPKPKTGTPRATTAMTKAASASTAIS
jgi:hypothetical protein